MNGYVWPVGGSFVETEGWVFRVLGLSSDACGGGLAVAVLVQIVINKVEELTLDERASTD